MPFTKRFRQLRHFGRFRQISTVLIKYGFGEFLDRAGVASLYYRTRRLFLRKEPEIARLNYSHRIRLALEELGPTFVKLGQVLSTRPFLIPPDLVFELTKLQDQVAPFPFAEAKKTVETELGKPLPALFSDFDQKAIASASPAQV